MKKRIVDILANMSDQVCGRDIILPRREAEIIADKLIDALGDIVYVCDGGACENCGIDCNHTHDIRHAKNFTEVAPGKFMENYEVKVDDV